MVDRFGLSPDLSNVDKFHKECELQRQEMKRWALEMNLFLMSIVIPDGVYYPAPKKLPAFPKLNRARPKTPVQGGQSLRKRWKDPKGRIYEWDSKTGAVEKYSKQGKHIGEYDPNTGVQLKPSNPKYRVEP